MSFLRAFWRDSLRGQLTGPRNWILLLLLPALTFSALRLMPAREVSAPVQVGVVLPRGEEDFWNLLEERSGLVVEFRRSELDQARRQVAAGRWDCALILPEDFSRRLDRLELEGLITVLISSGSTVYPLVRETVAACVAQRVSPGMAEKYLLDSGIADTEDLPRIRPRLEEVLLEQDRVLVSMETADGGGLDPIALADQGTDKLLTGITAVLLIVWALFAAMDLGRWLDSPFARRLAPCGGVSSPWRSGRARP